MPLDNIKGISKDSYVTVGLAVMLIGMAITGTSWLQGKFNDQVAAQVKLSRELEEYHKDRWTGTDMFRWASQLKNENRQITVPDPKHQDTD
jgi:hypothetical protein